jgi:septal ring factor EnvC (AmiA/AmiB activator)
MKKFLVVIVLFSLYLTGMAQPAQDRAKMEKERQSIQKEIKEIQSVYNQVKGQRKETIGQLNLLQKKMILQGQYINNINKEIKIITDEVYLSNLEINRLQRQLDTLKMQYSRSVVYAYKNKSTYDYLNFIFSASSFNDALKRISYLKSYRSYRQQQVASIVKTQKTIEDKKQQLIGKKTEKNSALKNQTQQLGVLEEQKKEKDDVVAKLKSQEKDLQTQIAARKKRDAQLKGAIAVIVRREIEAARKKAEEEARRKKEAEKAERERVAREKIAREKAAKEKATANASKTKTTASKTTSVSSSGSEATTVTSPVTEPTVSTAATKPASRPKSYLDLNETDIALNNSFEKNKGRLPWPVDNGFISIPFGNSKVGGLTMDNPGITISTPSVGSSVKSVFDGEVSSVASLGDGMMVVVRHGKYFTAYSNLSSASVSKGMSIRTGQVIGRASTADDGNGGQIDFLLMIESRNVNPEPWLR